MIDHVADGIPAARAAAASNAAFGMQNARPSRKTVLAVNASGSNRIENGS